MFDYVSEGWRECRIDPPEDSDQENENKEAEQHAWVGEDDVDEADNNKNGH
jgi:hypothetical protein